MVLWGMIFYLFLCGMTRKLTWNQTNVVLCSIEGFMSCLVIYPVLIEDYEKKKNYFFSYWINIHLWIMHNKIMNMYFESK